MKAIIATLGVLAAAAVAQYNGFSPQELAFYATPDAVAFVRPGIAVTVLGAEIDANRTIRARLRVTDTRGLPLDRLGITTPGPVAISLIAAVMPKDGKHWVSYTTRVQTSPITNVAATQAAADAQGTWTQTGDGEYTYTFRTQAPANYDRTATHAIGVYGNRNLSEFELGTNYYSTIYKFVPAGGTPGPVREITKNGTCNACHVEITAHGGSRRGLDMCILCHQPQTTDPDTGQTVDMTVMTHKIHMGRNLPSVVAGKPYQIIGNAQSLHDYSKVVYPANVKNCASCHPQTGANAGAQAAAMYNPTRDSCGSCHDGIDFAAGKGHPVQTDDTRCATCHRPDSENEFDLSIKGAHTIQEFSKNITGQTFEFVEIRNTRPGERPVVTFRLRDTATGAAIPPADMTSLSLVLAGPTSDYQFYRSETARLATQNPGGTNTYTFTNAIPENLPGSYSISVEGYRNRTFQGPGRQNVTVRDPLKNVVRTFATTGGPVEARRTVVTLAKCNQCHANLELHGRNRNQIEHCVTCHNPTVTDVARRTAAQLPAESVNFGTMVHRIHTGEEQGRPYVIYGFGGNAIDFSEARSPADVANCAICHVNNSQRLPLSNKLVKVNDPRGWLTEVGPGGAACLGCHASRDAAVHVQLNTTSLGEACGVCHGPNADLAVDKVHAR